MKKEVLRIIDANSNRSREGLRVCEDITRFILNSNALTGELKRVRHRISDIVKCLPVRSQFLLVSRDVKEDVGRKSWTRSEKKRLDYADIFMANIERVKESLRVLEELVKLIDERASASLKALRFKVYEIEKKAVRRIIYPKRSRGMKI